MTGSIHCVLVKYWKERLRKDSFKAYQLSERGGMLKLKLNGERVKILGEAIRGHVLDETEA